MLKQLTIAAFAATAVSALAQDSMTTIDAKAAKPGELMSFLEKDAYKKLSAPDAYIIVDFLGGLPGNYRTALARGLALNAQEAYDKKTENQTAANGMAPMGDGSMDMSSDMSKDMVMMAPKSYMDTVATLQKTQDATDQTLIGTLFHPISFTKSLIPTVENERVLDAISRYIKANAASTKPVRLKYTSLATHTYAGLPSDWSSKPWPAGS